MTEDAARSGARFAPTLGRGDIGWLIAFVPLTVLLTRPIAWHLTTSLSGERDAWQNLWNIVWVHRALARGQSPFFTHDLWHPDGATLVFQTFDLPDALWASILVGHVHPWLLYNLVVLWTFVASGAAMYVLGRDGGASRAASFFAGCAYTFGTYHFAHALAHLHLLAMQWVPLYVLAFRRVLERRSWRWAVAAGLLLALSTLASWYYLFADFLISLALTVVFALRTRGRGLPALLLHGAILSLVFLALIGPLALEMVRQRATQPLEGAHPAGFYSADLQSFYRPNPAQMIAAIDSHFARWTGNVGEIGEYLGATFIVLVLVGLLLRGRYIGGYLLAGLLGIALSLGPALHVGGVARPGDFLPYAWLLRAFPFLEFAGMPCRFAFVANFALAAALAPALDAIHRKVSWWILAPIATLGLLEHFPHPLTMTELPTPAPMLDWARDPRPFAVLDVEHDGEHAEWHQTLHGHPVFGVWLSRTPTRLIQKLAADPVAGPLQGGTAAARTAQLHVSALDFAFDAPIVDGAEHTHFAMDLAGTLQVAQEGPAQFRVRSDDGSWLSVDGKRVVEIPGMHPALERSGEVALTAGPHTLAIHYEQIEGDAVLKAWWKPPGGVERVVGSPDLPEGLSGNASFRRRELNISREEALAHLRALHVRYIVQPQDDPRYIPETQLGLKPGYEGEGVRIYELASW